jgi:Negative regulator of sigma E activity
VSVEYNLGGGHSKIDYVSPAGVRGRVVVNDGRSRWEYNPAEKVVIQSPVFRHPVRSSAIKSTVSRVNRAYSLAVSQPAKRVAGRRLFRLDFSPRLGDRESKIWWIDRATGLVLRRDVLDSHARVRQTTEFRSIRYHPPSDLTVARYVPADGVKVVTRNGAHAVFDYEKSKSLLPSWARIPASIGEGFEFDNARIVHNNGIQTVQVQYSDGLVGVSLFVSPGAVHPEADTGAVRLVSLGSIKGSVVEPFPPYLVLSWTVSGKTYSLVADITEAALVTIARKLL